MVNLQSPACNHVDSNALNFLKENPAISRSLLADCNHDFDKVSTFVGPIVKATERCTSTSYYIQAATTGRTAFLTTNLFDFEEARVTEIASTWLIGRSRNCAIAVPDPSISRCHAVIGHSPLDGFYVMDVGSSNGTFINHQRLPTLERRALQDGDMVSLSHIHVEFFLVSDRKATPKLRLKELPS
ncbi:MAG: FHA domain-containing protein [Leptolyngbyaceae cyanobacterium CSU_1_3]|nr:FHA domain-containing protein [Leptolyngbyaceae cyanobacterium CSU_1_3]